MSETIFHILDLARCFLLSFCVGFTVSVCVLFLIDRRSKKGAGK